MTCTNCKKQTHPLEVFPGQICLDCHEVKMAKEPITKPDFVGAIQKERTTDEWKELADFMGTSNFSSFHPNLTN